MELEGWLFDTPCTKSMQTATRTRPSRTIRTVAPPKPLSPLPKKKKKKKKNGTVRQSGRAVAASNV